MILKEDATRIGMSSTIKISAVTSEATALTKYEGTSWHCISAVYPSNLKKKYELRFVDSNYS